jgi:hypothetical protein
MAAANMSSSADKLGYLGGNSPVNGISDVAIHKKKKKKVGGWGEGRYQKGKK